MMYYIDNVKDEATVVIELDNARPEGGFSLFGVWNIIRYIIGQPNLAGMEDNVQPGKTVSGNELNGVGVIGKEKYIFDEYKSIGKIFS